jgi:hypothetical protein
MCGNCAPHPPAVPLSCRVQLLDTAAVGVRREKMYKLDEHIACAVAGITGWARLSKGGKGRGGDKKCLAINHGIMRSMLDWRLCLI